MPAALSKLLRSTRVKDKKVVSKRDAALKAIEDGATVREAAETVAVSFNTVKWYAPPQACDEPAA